MYYGYGMKETILASFPVRVIRRYGAANAGSWAQVVAWNALFSCFPVILFTVTLAGILVHSSAFADLIEGRMAGAIAQGGDPTPILAVLHDSQTNSGILIVVSILTLAWSGSALFGALDQAINSLYPHPQRAFIAQKLMSVGMMLVFTVLTIFLVGSSSIVPLLDRIPRIPGLLHSTAVTWTLQAVLGVIAGTALFGAIYYVVPNRPQRLRCVVPGAIIAGFLLEAVTLMFPAYLAISHGFKQYGPFALFFILVTYLFFLGQIVMIGASVNAEIEQPEQMPGPEGRSQTRGARAERPQPVRPSRTGPLVTTAAAGLVAALSVRWRRRAP